MVLARFGWIWSRAAPCATGWYPRSAAAKTGGVGSAGRSCGSISGMASLLQVPELGDRTRRRRRMAGARAWVELRAESGGRLTRA